MTDEYEEMVLTVSEPCLDARCIECEEENCSCACHFNSLVQKADEP